MSRFGLARGWDTILEIACVLVTMVACTAYINRTLSRNAVAARTQMWQTYGVILQETQNQDSKQKELDTTLNLIIQQQHTELDRLKLQSDIISRLEKRSR